MNGLSSSIKKKNGLAPGTKALVLGWVFSSPLFPSLVSGGKWRRKVRKGWMNKESCERKKLKLKSLIQSSHEK